MRPVRDRGAEFCAVWWETARKLGRPPLVEFPEVLPLVLRELAETFGLSPEMADVLHRACLAEWKGGRR
jgi:hypothetical protein